MPRQHERRHAQPMAAQIEGELGQLARPLAPAIAGKQAADVNAIRQR
jgi:hypothetical protein